MKLTWYGHSCFGLNSAAGSVVFDPYVPGFPPGLAVPELSADLVLCSHGHDDHNAAQVIKLTGREPACRVTKIASWHDDANGAKRGANTIHIVEMEGQRVAHLGDLGHMLTAEQLEAMGRLDVLLVPVGGFYTIDAETARRVADASNAHIVVPMHYRGEGFGFDAISTVDGFVALSKDVEFAEGSSIELPDSGNKRTVVLRLK